MSWRDTQAEWSCVRQCRSIRAFEERLTNRRRYLGHSHLKQISGQDYKKYLGSLPMSKFHQK
jgi:hypothetical protein